MPVKKKTRMEKWMRQIFEKLSQLDLLLEVTLIRDSDTDDTHGTVTATTKKEYYNQYAYVDIITAENYEQFDVGVNEIGNYSLICEPTFTAVDESTTTIVTEDKIKFQDPHTHETINAFVKTINFKHNAFVQASLTKTP